MQNFLYGLAGTAALALALPQAATAEIILELEERDGDEIYPVQMLIASGKLAALDEDGEVEMIFDRASATIYTLDHDDRSFTRLNRENIDALVGQVDTAMAEMRRQLEALPPEQREMAERMMGGMMGNAGATRERPSRAMRPTGQQGEAAGIRCAWHNVFVGDEQVGTACVAAPDAVPGGDELIAMMTAMSEIYEELLDRIADSVPMAMPANPIMPMTEAGGLPIRSTEMTEDGTEMQITLLAVREEAVDPSRFEVPAGYREASFDD
ncbi:MAG: hypothetical protein JJT93_06375 [Gammaproteobacteria bacterium]|nr:hypothetical protein [Gammaproteobacteria bacterium]